MAVALRSQAPWNPTRLHMVPRETDCEEYPEIEAKFSLETYLLREAMLDAKIRPCASLPSGFPQRIDSSVVWSSSTLMPNETLYRLSSNEIEELEEPSPPKTSKSSSSNNRAVLHSQDKIEDSPDESQCHLVRLCLRDTAYGRPIPEDLKRRWGNIFDNGQHKDVKWMLSKENDPSFVSNRIFDSAFTNDETTQSHG
ncbi:hypothetical protein MMC09_005792 [Bachmanniomyces sp. S44760]|nr:hypothetical protein [Bachmanniomyces sp. S44760]